MEETSTKPDFLSGGGKMGELIRSKDWSKTPLGSPDTWPQSLRTAVSLCIASSFPICISWGPQRVQIYNDGYWPIPGDMHPRSMGQDFKECWISAWPVIGHAFEEASLGETRFLENQRIFLERYGYKEETFFTFSFSPILDESGAVGGLFHPVIEQTQQILTERRLTILQTLPNHTINARTAQETSALIMDCLKDFELDIPFALLYSTGDDGKEANLEGRVGVEKDSPLAPAKISIEKQAFKGWPLKEVVQNGKAVRVNELAAIFGTFNCGPYPEPPKQALVFPVVLQGTDHNNYFLVVGVSSRRNLDEKYGLFYELLAATVTNVLTKAKSYEEERKKAEALAEIDRAKTVFFSNISHEFRTPLTLMLSPLEELLNQKKNNLSESEKQKIGTTHRNAMRLLKLVNTLLEFSRIESGRQQAMFNLVDIVALTKNLASNFRAVIEKAGMKLIVKADTIIQPVYVDKQMWEKIVFNLLSNAFKYTLKGKITVELSAEKEFAVLRIIDTGVGIPENELPKMFERFHRVQNVAGRTYEGTGIGLSLIKELVQMHHGIINVESKLNDGSVFTVKIPFGKEHLNGHQISKTEIDSDEISTNIYVEEIETLLETDRNQKVKSLTSKEKSAFPTVLVVDDNADMREHISSILSNNFNVITAINGMDALHKMKETTPALVLSDIMMPVMDGIGLLKEIRNNKSTANIPVIFLTARAGEESKIEGLETGADDYLVKPFSSKELLARIHAQINIIKLRQSLEGNVRNLFMDAPAIICVLRGPQHVYELANEMYLHLIGKRNIVGKTVRKALPELEGQGFFELLDTVYATGEPFIGNEMPAQLDKGNGKLEEVYLNFTYQPSHNSEGEIDGIFVHGVDVTEQVLARKKIKENEMQLQSIFFNAPAAIAVITGPEHAYVLANNEYQNMVSRTSEQLLGKTSKAIFPELAGTGTFEIFDGIYQSGQAFSLPEYPVKLDKNKDGNTEQMYFRFSAVPLKDAEGKFDSIVIVSIDITEQVLARKKIEESEKQQAFLLKLSDALRPLGYPADIEEAATNTAMDFMEADRCHYSTIEEDNVIILRDASRGDLPSVAGVHPISSFPLYQAVLNAGSAFVVDDVHTTNILDEGLKKMCLQFQYVSFINVPVIRNGKTVGLLSLVQCKPRKWTDEEVQLSIETAERIWAAVERANAEEKIKESEERFKIALAGSNQIVFSQDRNLKHTWIYNSHPDFKPEDIIDKSDQELHVPDTAKILTEIKTKVLDTGKSFYGDVEIELGGQWVTYTLHLEATRDAVSKITGISGMVMDITEKVKAQRKIIESEQRFRSLVEQAPVAICVIRGDDYVYEVVNEKYLQLIGKTKEEIMNMPVFIAVPEAARQGYKEVLDGVYKTGIPFNATESPTTLIRNGKEETIYTNYIYEPLYNIEHKIDGVFAVFIDVTEQLLARQKVEESNKELIEAKEFAENTAKAKQQFLSNMSHEIRTPLNSILGFTNVLQKTDLGAEQKEFLQAIKTSGNSLNLLINDILDLAKVDAGRMTFDIQPFEIRKSIKSILYSFDLKVKEKNLELIKEFDTNIPVILLGDSVRLNQIILNLMSNAIKFTHKGKVVLVVKLLSQDEENVTIEFALTDSGIGIANNKVDSIFKVFEQAEIGTANTYGGTGLGLAIVKQLIEAQGGSISLKSKLGEGSTFSFILPFGKTNIKSEEEIEIPKPDSENKSLRVLVAEDVALNQLLIKIILSDFGFEFEIVDNGKIAIEKLQTNTYDIILMDLQMPEMNGFQATDYIRQTAKSQIPIIALTADVTNVDVSKCKEFGMDDYISKPINESLLYSKIVELVNMKRSE